MIKLTDRFNSLKTQRALILVFLMSALLMSLGSSVASETWRGLVVTSEYRCSPYDRKRDYKYSSSLEKDIVKQIGKIFDPYTGTCFNSTKETDIEHIVALSEAHDSGLCAEDRQVRKEFAKDIRNLTIASPVVNRSQKGGKDAGEWLPDINKCWFAGRVLEVKHAYGLTIDQKEAKALENILANCTNTSMKPATCLAFNETSSLDVSSDVSDVLQRYDDNQNGRITCKEARRHGITPVPKSHPAYQYMNDSDHDGVVCE